VYVYAGGGGWYAYVGSVCGVDGACMTYRGFSLSIRSCVHALVAAYLVYVCCLLLCSTLYILRKMPGDTCSGNCFI